MSRHPDRPSTNTKRFTRALVLIAVLALLPAAPAFSADPATPPEVDAHLQFVIGGVVDPFTSCDQHPIYAGFPAELHVGFSGLDAQWVDDVLEQGSWGVEQFVAGGPSGGPFASGLLADPDTTLTMVYPVRTNNYDGDCGGGSAVLDRWEIEATNPGAPSATTRTIVGAYPVVYQEDGTDLTMERPDADITTRGKWRSSYCDCWLGGEVLRTWQKWARMRLTIDAIDGQVVAVVMPMAPNRGVAKLKVDDVYQGRVDTYSPTRDNRIIVWQTAPLDAGTHTIDVINLATEGRPRIDVDAFLVTYGNVEP